MLLLEEIGHALRGLWQPEESQARGPKIHKTKESYLGVTLGHLHGFLKIQIPMSSLLAQW